MRGRNVLALALLCLTAGITFGSGSPGAQTRSAGFRGRWATDAARAFTNGGSRPSAADDAIVVEIQVDPVDARRASGLVTEFTNPLCGDSDAKLPFNNGAINGRTITFSVTRPGSGDCPPRVGGNGVQVSWTATLSDDEQTLTGSRNAAGGGRGQAGRGQAGRGGANGGPGAGAPDAGRARGTLGPGVNSPGGVLAPPVGTLTPAVPALGPAVPTLTPAVPTLGPAVPALGPASGPAAPNADARGRGNRGGPGNGGGRGAGGVIVLRRLPDSQP